MTDEGDNMGITWKYVKPLKRMNVVKAYLEDNHIDLPLNLVHIIEVYNGGRPSVKRIVTIEGTEYAFKSLLSYNKDDLETIYSVYPTLFKETPLFPIGSDGAGNFICYQMDSKNYVLWNHETGREEKIIEIPFIQ